MKDFDKLDRELDGMMADDFDIQEDDGSREPDLSLAQKIKTGIKSNVMNTNLTDMAKSTAQTEFPKLAGKDASDAFDNAKIGIEDELKGVKAELRESSEELVNFLKGKTKSGSMMNNAIKKVEGFLKDESKVKNTASEIDRARDDINRTFGSNKLELSNLELLKQTALASSSSDKSKVTLAISQLEVTKYSAALQERYFKKSIELKYRHIIETKRGNKASEEKSNLILESLLSIAKNTGLPDAVKIKSAEVFKLQASQQMSKGLYDYIGLKERFSNVIGKNLKRKAGELRDKVTGSLSSIDTLAGGANMVDGLVDEDMLASMSPEDRAEYSKTGMVSGLVTGGVIGMAKDKALNLVRNKVASSDRGAKAINTINKVMSDPSRYFSDKEDKSTNRFTRKLYEFLGDISTDSDLKGGAKLRTTAGNLEDIASFDMRTYNSLNNHIPGLLSKILREVTVISTGNPDVSELKFDNVRGEFSVPKSVKSTIKKELEDKQGKSVANKIKHTIERMEKRAGISLSPEERKIFTKELLTNGSNLNTDYVDGDVENGLFSNLDSKTSMKFTSLIREAGSYKTLDKDGNVVIDNGRSIETNSDLADIYSNNIDMVKRLESLVMDGYGDELVKAGLMSYDTSTNEYRVISSAVSELNAEVVVSAFETTEPDIIKAPKPEKAKATDEPYVKMEEMKDRVSSLFANTRKEDILSRLNDLSDKMKPGDVEELKAFVSTNYQKSKDVYDGISEKAKSEYNSISDRAKSEYGDVSEKPKRVYGSVEKDVFDIASATSSKRAEIAAKALDRKKNGKNFFDKMGESVVSAIAKSKDVAKTKFDSDDSGRRDGSWMDFFDKKKEKIESEDGSGGIKGLLKGRKPGGMSGVLLGILPILGTVIGKALSFALHPFSSILKPLKFLKELSGIGGVLSFMSNTLLAGLSGISRTIATAANMIRGVILAKGLLSTGVGSKVKGVGRFLSRNKGKIMIGAGLATMFGSTKLFGSDSVPSVDTISSGMGFDKIQASMTSEGYSDGDSLEQDSGLGIDPLTGLMIGSMVAPSAISGTKSLIKRTKDMKGPKEALSKAARSAEDAMKSAGSKMSGKVIGKGLSKVIPGLNIVAGAASVYDDIENGDYGKAALHTMTTALNFIPLIGMPLSILGDMAIDSYSTPDVTSEQQSIRDSVREQTKATYAGRRRGTVTGSADTSSGAIRAGSQKKSETTKTMNARSRAKKNKFESISNVNAGDRLLLETISSHESSRGPSGYEMVYKGYKDPLPKPLTAMTLGEVSRLQTIMVKKIKNNKSSAVGKYQFVTVTFVEVRNAMGLSMSTLFTPAVQDKMILFRLNQKRHYDTWKEGGITDDEFIENLSMEFASLPSVSKNGKSYYAGVGSNKALTSLESMRTVLSKVRAALGMPEAEPSEIESGAKLERVSESTKESSGLVSGIKMAMEAVMKFFGSSAISRVASKPTTTDGDSSTNKPLINADKRVNGSGRLTKVGTSGIVGSATEICGLKITRLPAIPKAVNDPGNKKFANGIPRNLVIHNTASNSLSFSRMKNQGFGTQFWIDKSGTIYLVGDVDQVLYHVGDVKNKALGVRSSNSLGIEMVCNYDSARKSWEPYTVAQATSLQQLSACIRQKFDIPPERIFYHEQISPKTKDEGREGAIIAKTGAVLMAPDDSDAVDSNSISEDTGLPMTTATQPMAINLNPSPKGVDGDSSTNKPDLMSGPGLSPAITKATQTVRPVVQEDPMSKMVTKFSKESSKYFYSMDESLKSLVEINTKIFESLSNKPATPAPVTKEIPIDKKPPIGLKS